MENLHVRDQTPSRHAPARVAKIYQTNVLHGPVQNTHQKKEELGFKDGYIYKELKTHRLFNDHWDEVECRRL